MIITLSFSVISVASLFKRSHTKKDFEQEIAETTKVCRTEDGRQGGSMTDVGAR